MFKKKITIRLILAAVAGFVTGGATTLLLDYAINSSSIGKDEILMTKIIDVDLETIIQEGYRHSETVYGMQYEDYNYYIPDTVYFINIYTGIWNDHSLADSHMIRTGPMSAYIKVSNVHALMFEISGLNVEGAPISMKYGTTQMQEENGLITRPTSYLEIERFGDAFSSIRNIKAYAEV